MTVAGTLALALRMLRRDLRSGELRLLAAAVVVAVASVTTVGFFVDRVQQALTRGANELLGADLVLTSSAPPAPELAGEARRLGLQVTESVRFPSMVVHGERSVLAEVKAVGPGYPLRGPMRVADAVGAAERTPAAVPPQGAMWADDKLLAQLAIGVGDVVDLGNARLRVVAVLVQEPDVNVSFLNLGPRAIFNRADLDATGLVQPGSRIAWRLLAAGEDGPVAAFRAWAGTRLERGQRLEGVRDARPEVRSALARAERFTGLASLVSVALAAVAVLLAARRYVQRHLDGCAVMRCLGAGQGRIVALHLAQFVVLALAASGAGTAIGYAAQHVLAGWLSGIAGTTLPAPTVLPAVQGVATGLLLLLGFGLPPLLALGRVPTLRVLRRELGIPQGLGLAGYLLGGGAIAFLIAWKADDAKLAALALGGFGATVVVSALVVWALLRAAVALRQGTGGTWRFGLASLRRHSLGTVLQVVSLGLGIMALLTLTLVRGDLLRTWRTTLPPDAPNRFLVNVQPDQVEALKAHFARSGIAAPPMYPMVRGRLVGINERAVSSASYSDERARRLVDREFNLSWAERLGRDNVVVAGRWFTDADRGGDGISMEEGLAKTLGIALGDRLSWEIAGQRLEARVTSLRKVDWDSFRANFFAVFPPGRIEQQPATWMTSFYVPPERVAVLHELARAFPNVLVIDIANIIGQVTRIMDQVAAAVQFVFVFTLAAGLLVLYAAVVATRDERVQEAAVMRTLGASRRQLRIAHFTEFASIGALAGFFAAGGASVLGYVVATRIFNLDIGLSGSVWVAGIAGGMVGVTLAGLLVTRSVLDTSPLASLRREA